MAFKRPLPEWNNPGVEPPQSKKDMGWLGREKPPAQWHNWYQHLTYEALKELQENAAHVTFGNTPPDSPDVNDLWVDTSEEPPILKRFDGTQWTEIGKGGVSSVNGKTGDVELTAEDVGAASLTDFNEHLRDKIQDGVHGLATTQNMTLYVDGTNGDDSNDGLTPQTAFKSIQKAVDSVPKIIRHSVTIQIADGTYDEEVMVSGFHAIPRRVSNGANFTITGNENDRTAVKVRTIKLWDCVNSFRVQFLEVFGAERPIDISGCSAIGVSNVVLQTPGERGITVNGGDARIENCEISNKEFAILGVNGATIHALNNTGTNNTNALAAREGSRIAINGTQPSGDENATINGAVLTGRFRLVDNYSIEIRHPSSAYKPWIVHRSNISTLSQSLIFAPRTDDGTGWDWSKQIVFTDRSKIAIGNANIGIIVGTGSPEGNVTAPTGCIYLQQNGPVYVKTSGTGNTGWRQVQTS